jgi:mutator protein MutT
MMTPSSATPRRPTLGVSVLVRKEGSVLLVRRSRPPFAGMWSLPGGHVEWGETLAEAAIREVAEETGVTIDAPKPVDTIEFLIPEHGRVERHIVLLVHEGRYVRGVVAPGDDAADARWVSLADAAGLDITEEARRLIMAGDRLETI